MTMTRGTNAMSSWYKLDKDNNPIVCQDHAEYFAWHQSLPKETATGVGVQLARTGITIGVSVSTVFLGTDHAISGRPVLWETMIFGGDRNEECHRYTSHSEAIAGHNSIVNEMQLDLLNRENVALREALKQARKFWLSLGYTTRHFSEIVKVTAMQLSAWTDEIPDREPDFKD
jgi:hypothetical protein